MGFNIFKRKEKEIISSDNANNSNDIVDDFSSFVESKTNINNTTQKNKSDSIFSFDSNFSEGIGSSYEINDSNSIIDDNKKENLNNNFQYSYNEEINENSYENLQSFIPYNNNLETYASINEEDIEQPDVVEETNNNNLVENINNIEETINESQDINVVLRNTYNNSNSKKSNDILETNTVQNFSSTPIIENQYQNSDVDPGYRICPKCGQKIREDYKQCFVCGTTF